MHVEEQLDPNALNSMGTRAEYYVPITRRREGVTAKFKFTVSGRHHFPFDMLRYDMAYPYGQDDVLHMDTEGRAMREVTLIAPRVTPARWASFGWVVTKLELVTIKKD